MHQSLKTLSLSDIVVQFIYSPNIRQRFSNVDLVIGCGDLPYYYLEYVISMLDAPLFFVRGNHDKEIEYGKAGKRHGPLGGVDLHRKVIRFQDTLLAGVEGCLRYRYGPFLYTQGEMWRHVFALVPGLFRNKLEYGRYLDVFITHAPPRGIHDGEDLAHFGINAFRWLLKVFQPAYHFHGHIHIYRPDVIIETCFHNVQVINTFGHRETSLDRIPSKNNSI